MERLDNAGRALFALGHFQDLTADDLRALESFVEHRFYRAGELIVREGDAGDTVFFLVSGRAEVRRVDAKGKPEAIHLLEHDAVFGEMAFLNQAPRSAGIVALEDTHVVALSRENFTALCRVHPALGLRVLEQVSRATSLRLRDVDRELMRTLEASRRHRMVAIALLALFIVAAVVLHVYLAKINTPPPAPELTAYRAAATEHIVARASLERFGATEVVARTSGVVQRVAFEDGQGVVEGAFLAEIDGTERAADLRRAEEDLRERRLALAALPADAPDRRAAEQQEWEAEFAVFEARARLAQTKITAPHEGTVSTYGAVPLAPGALIRQGDVAAVVHRPGSWGVAFRAEGRDAARFPLGRTVRLRVPEAYGADLYAEVVSHLAVADAGADVRLLLKEVPPEAAARLAVGQECRILDSGGTR